MRNRKPTPRPPASGRDKNPEPSDSVAGREHTDRRDGAEAPALAECRAALMAARSERRTVEQLLALVRIGLWEADLVSGRVWWSEELCRMHGAEPGDVPTLEHTVGYYAPESRGHMADALRLATEDGSAWNVALTLLTAEGRRFRARTFGRVEFADGEAARLFGAVQYLGDWTPR